jgi:hypothetical protein
LIFLDTNVVSETLKKSPSPAVVAWLVRFDVELALPTVTIAEIAFGIHKTLPDRRASRLDEGLAAWRRGSLIGYSGSQRKPLSPMANSWAPRHGRGFPCRRRTA